VDRVSRPLVPPAEWQGKGSRRPFSFANGVEIDYETGAIYFTETSTRFQRWWKNASSSKFNLIFPTLFSSSVWRFWNRHGKNRACNIFLSAPVSSRSG
jgi:hypothetical protein